MPRKKVNLFRKIYNESDNVLCYEPYVWKPIDYFTYIVAYMTDAGVQPCGLYFKVIRYAYSEYELDAGKPLDICRISMERPEYIEGFDETFRLNEMQKQNMIRVLGETYQGYEKPLWEHIFDDINQDIHFCIPIGFNDPYTHIPIFKPWQMPDYSKL